jgi:hypothetical protein
MAPRKYWRPPGARILTDPNNSHALGSRPGANPLGLPSVQEEDIAAWVDGAPPAIQYPLTSDLPPGSPDAPPLFDPSADPMTQLQQMLQGLSLKTLGIYLPEVFPIPSAVEFQQFGSGTIVGVNSQLVLAGTRIQIPNHCVGIARTVNIFGGGAGGLTFATNLQYTIRINGAGAPGWTNRTFFGRTASSVEQAFDAFIRIPDGATVDALVTDVDGGSYTVGLWFAGWYWPAEDGRRWMAGQGSYGGI